ncbi:acyl-CoA N-acyltransferase, partial [Wolfiporia cocos MD-104 SS10]
IGITYVIASDMQNEANVGIALLPDWRGKGIATHALTLTLSWAFTQYACHRVQGLIMDGPFRDVARAALTSLGFSHEGTRRRAVLSTAFVGWRDVTYMAMLDTDWVMREHRKPRDVWDEMFKRHHREREELLQFETRLKELRRAPSAETIR